jgi:hypothetical protein
MIMNRMVLSPLQLSGSIYSRTTVEQFDRVLTKVFVDDVSRAVRHEHRAPAGEGVRWIAIIHATHDPCGLYPVLCPVT